MKLYRFSAFFFAAALACGMTACSDADDAISDLTGVYAAPTDLTITGATVDFDNKAKNGDLRIYPVDFTTSEGKNVHLVLVTNKYFIDKNGYTYAPLAEAKNGNFTDGSTIDGKPITGGTFSLVKDETNYTINKCTLFASDGAGFRMSGVSVMDFEPDDPTPLTAIKPSYDAMGQSFNVVDNGNGTVTVTFTDGKYKEGFDMTTYQTTYEGEGYDFQIIFKLADGKLKPGIYSPGTGYVAGYTFMNNAYEAWGVPAFEDFAGTIWYTIANGAKVPTLVTTGDIVVTKNGPLYTILIDQGKGGVYAQYTGSIAELDPDGESVNVTMMSSVTSVTNWASFGWGVNLIDVVLANGDVAGKYDAATQSTVYSGTGKLLQIEFFSADGVLTRGEYEISADMGEGKVQAGCDNQYAPGTPGGCYIVDVTDGTLGEATYITSGTVKIEGEGDSTSITITSGDDIYMFTGNIGL